MKKVVCLFLISVLCLPLLACSSKSKKEKILSTAVELDGYTFYQEYNSNKVRLSNQYEGNACLVEGSIYEIENNHIVVTDSNLMVNAYIPKEEIVELQKGQYVKVAGILKNIDFKQNMSLIWVTVDFKTAYLLPTTYTKTGIYRSHHSTDGSHPQGVYLECVNSSGKTYFIELVLTEDQMSVLENGTEVTVEGTMSVNDNTMPHSAYNKMNVIAIK